MSNDKNEFNVKKNEDISVSYSKSSANYSQIVISENEKKSVRFDLRKKQTLEDQYEIIKILTYSKIIILKEFDYFLKFIVVILFLVDYIIYYTK